MSISETQYINNSSDLVRNSYLSSNAPIELQNKIQELFTWIDIAEYTTISSPAYHEVLDENVISLTFPAPYSKTLMQDENVIIAGRKLCLSSKTSFINAYYLFEGQKPSWMLEQAKILSITKHFEEFGRQTPIKYNDYYDLYFMGPEEQIEQHFNLDPKRGTYSTFYGATVLSETNSLVRIKQYCYDIESQNLYGTLADWDIAYIANCKRLGKEYLLEQ